MYTLLLCYLVLASLAGWLIVSKVRFDRARDSIQHRIHVNGIRGKSTVTRYISAILRDANIRTYGKTTGTAARVIMPDGKDAIIQRRGHANVNEQLGIIRSFAARGAQAAVVECMAINPDYQDWLENKVMRSQIVVITNVRLDHQEEMGERLTDIARSLARSIPTNATLITAERQPEVLTILRQVCRQKRTKLVLAPVERVRTEHLQKFSHVAHEENIAIGLAVAEIFGVSDDAALASMASAPADPGAFQIQHFQQRDKHIAWANLFAVNDKESFARIANDLAAKYANHYKVALLNNRHDRPSRVEMFSKLAQDNLRADAVVALGDYEDRVKKSVTKPQTRVVTYGNTSKLASSTGNELLQSIAALADKQRILLVGTVNIHTRQSEQILDRIAQLTQSTFSGTDDLQAYDPSKRFSGRLQNILRKVDAVSQTANEPRATKGEDALRAV